MGSKNSLDMTTGSVVRKLLIFVYPIFITNLLQHLYNAADSMVVGQFSGKIALAAVGATAVSVSLLTNLYIGFTAGGSIMFSNLLGAKKHYELRKSMHTGIVISGIYGSVLTILGVTIARPLLSLLNCPANVIDHSTLYLRIIACGMPGAMLYNMGAAILRTHGDSKRPMIIMSVCGLINVLLNLLFVIAFKMSVAGVALATIISNYTSAAWVLSILFNKKDLYKLDFKELRIHKPELINITKVGVPCALNGILFNISALIVNSATNRFGASVIAGNAASTTVTNLLNQIITAFFSGAMSFSGQCYGAQKFKRIDKVAVVGTGMCVAITSLIAVAMTIVPQFFIGLFNSDPTVIEMGSKKLVLMSWGSVLYGMSDICLGCLRGMKKTAIPTAMNVFCVCIIRILWVMFVAPLNPDSFILLQWCYPISYFLSSVLLIGYYLYCRKKYFVVSPLTAS